MGKKIQDEDKMKETTMTEELDKKTSYPDKIEKPSLFFALAPIVLTIILVAMQVFYYDDVSPHIPLAIGVVITALFGWYRGYKWKDMQEGMFNVIHVGLPAIFIIYIIGMIIGVWIQSGTVPLMIYYGLQVLDPSLFLFSACLLCSVVSVTTGTSWGTTGTMGLALIGIGEGLGVPSYMTAGAVVSGAFFGDKISPLSDTTNLSPAVVGSDLFTHIKNMIPVTLPAMVIALGVYLYVGMSFGDGVIEQTKLDITMQSLESQFSLSPLLLIPAIIVTILAVMKMPAIPGLFTGVIIGAACAMIFQGVTVHEVFNAMLNGYKSNTGVAEVDSLLSKGGVMSMNWTITLILIAFSFGGILESTRCLETILDRIMQFAKTQAKTMLSGLASVFGVHVVTGDVFIAMALPGRMLAPAFRGKGIHVTALSRSMEDAGTLTAPLIPWSSGAVFVTGALGVATLDYLPWAIACWCSLFIDVIYSVTGMFIPKATEEDYLQWQERDEAILIDGVLTSGSQINKSVLPQA
ncbi:Na+/H+ antiporter NhaC [Oceanimonas pelagia]|uniref:Na+/H+ antiporter NhaC n=1 Tax=Oceanimonas pelagia TaxID=3028314 RepID=A0AA50KLV1_9GAMM|nr:Na+/H+ antiporter NhaC [Oceanimonas pelagia]WMC09844.1 Na+/H+ antiporter NhaC [Oceanimonas pelagia]